MDKQQLITVDYAYVRKNAVVTPKPSTGTWDLIINLFNSHGCCRYFINLQSKIDNECIRTARHCIESDAAHKQIAVESFIDNE